jgi:hypothetical protein
MSGLATAMRNDVTVSGSAAGEARQVVDARRQALSAPFAVTRAVRIPQEAVRRLHCGGAEGSRTWRFDLYVNRRSAGTTSAAGSYAAAVVELRSSLDMQLAISRRGPLRKPTQLDAPELEIGSDALRQRFVVRSDSPTLADEVLDDQLCAWLAGPGRGFHYEVSEDRVLAYGRRRIFGGRAALCAALGFATLLRDRQLTTLMGAHASASSSTSTPSPLKHTSPAIFIASARGNS